ncbi:hypothetical protein CLV52_2758 [Amnibacterium kyonggiense]|uniref:Uncharacterized protein n=1 Tax=Amnibacterium kyonggiense TaxID=595671 RepID=A0A4R7FI81_9MICO|nr:hypothetical protein CLV52_2758 [Amnibacterium kyonggiense]
MLLLMDRDASVALSRRVRGREVFGVMPVRARRGGVAR